MRRTLQPEWLDLLPPTHPAAIRNRRDLRLTNFVMRNHAWVVRTLTRLSLPGERAVELGAGTGELGIRLARRGLAIDGIERWPRPAGWPPGDRWHQVDVRTFAGWGEYRIIIGNLIFHQFSDVELRALGKHFQHARVVVACEPARRRASQWAYAVMAPLFGANQVSLHDAHVSIAAGFADNELASLLGLVPEHWDVRCTTSLLGAYRMVAVRRS